MLDVGCKITNRVLINIEVSGLCAAKKTQHEAGIKEGLITSFMPNPIGEKIRHRNLYTCNPDKTRIISRKIPNLNPIGLVMP